MRLEPGPRSLGVQSLGGGGLGGGLSPRLNPLHHGSKSSGGLIKSSTALLGSRSSPALRYPPPRRLHPPRPARVSYSPPSASSATEGEGPGARDTPIPPRAASPESYYPSTGEGPGARVSCGGPVHGSLHTADERGPTATGHELLAAPCALQPVNRLNLVNQTPASISSVCACKCVLLKLAERAPARRSQDAHTIRIRSHTYTGSAAVRTETAPVPRLSAADCQRIASHESTLRVKWMKQRGSTLPTVA